MIDKKLVADFWESHARSVSSNQKLGLANLEIDPNLAEKKINIERTVLSSYVSGDSDGIFLDFGAGYGEWSLFFNKMFKKIIAYEQSDTMYDIFLKKVTDKGIKNVEVIKKDVSEIDSIDSFSVALLSGILIYLSDTDVEHILQLLFRASNSRSIIVLRDATGVNGDYSIEGKFSEVLQQNYHAFYRSKEHYIEIFKANGFDLLMDQDMFDEGSELNKWQETRLRVYKFAARVNTNE